MASDHQVLRDDAFPVDGVQQVGGNGNGASSKGHKPRSCQAVLVTSEYRHLSLRWEPPELSVAHLNRAQTHRLRERDMRTSEVCLCVFFWGGGIQVCLNNAELYNTESVTARTASGQCFLFSRIIG